MKMNNIKMIALAAVVSTQLIGGAVYASHELENQAAVPDATADGHMSWHEFRHELGAFSGINASMDHHGIVTLSGHADDSGSKNMIERLASKIRGASDIRSTITAD